MINTIHLGGAKAHPRGDKKQSTSEVKKMRLHLGGVISKNGFTTFSLLRSVRHERSLHERGFTLVEMLVVMAITAIAGIILVVIFTNTLRGSNKSQILSAIKQNGQSVLENMDKTIRNADNVLCPAAGNTMVVEKNGVYTRYRIALPGDTTVPSSCRKNGCIVQGNPTKQRIPPVTGELETDTVFIRRVCEPNDPMSSAQVLTDTNTQSGVLIKSGSFTPGNSPGFKAVTTVKFILGPGAGAPPVLTNQIDPVTFQTTVQLR